MKFVVKLPGMTLYPGRGKHWWETITPDEMVTIAQRSEELGYDYLEVPTHFVMNHESAAEMGTRWVHSLSAAGFVFGATSTIRVVPLVCVPYHNPIELAKALSTLDYVSGGRLTPLLLLGYKEWEYDLLKVPFAEREPIMNEYIAAMLELWESDEPRFDGTYVQFDDVVFDPKPVQQPLPLWLGGHSKAAMRRIARFGDGWYSSMTPRAKFRESVEYIYAQPEYQENPRPLDLSLPIFEGDRDKITHEVLKQPKIDRNRDVILEQLHEIAALGCTMTDANDSLGIGKYQNDQPDAPPAVRDSEEYLERLQWFAEEVLPEAKGIQPPVLV
jgi:probable F420-dependent oxidoreductase